MHSIITWNNLTCPCMMDSIHHKNWSALLCRSLLGYHCTSLSPPRRISTCTLCRSISPCPDLSHCKLDILWSQGLAQLCLLLLYAGSGMKYGRRGDCGSSTLSWAPTHTFDISGKNHSFSEVVAGRSGQDLPNLL